MRQIYLAIEQYRSDYGGHEGDYTYNGLALPLIWDVGQTGLGVGEAWLSPCGADRTLFRTGPSWNYGWIGYGPGFYDPRWAYPGSPNNIEYQTYLADYRQNAVLLVDHYCNDAGTNLRDPFLRKRALAILLSGQVVNNWREGDALWLQFYSDPPEN